MAQKTYLCPRWPSLQIGACFFVDGRFTTDNQDLQAMIEGSEDFGLHVLLEGDEPQVIELGEEAGVQEEDHPPARQGRRGSSSLR